MGNILDWKVGPAIFLVMVLSAVSVSAQCEDQVIMQGSGWGETEGMRGHVALQINTAANVMRMEISVPGGWVGPDGQLHRGMLTLGEVTGYIIDGNTVTVSIWGQTFLLPSLELMSEGEGQFVGVLTGPKNKGVISLVGHPELTVSGIIIIT